MRKIPHWKTRFALPNPYRFQIAARNEDKALLVHNPSGTYQLFAWARSTNTHRALTDAPGGQIFGCLSPDGSQVFAVLAADGSEQGHLHAIPWEGGTPVNLTPELPPYTSFETAMADDNSLVAFCASFAQDNAIIVLDRDDQSRPPKILYKTVLQLVGPIVSPQGESVIFAVSALSRDLQESWDVVMMDAVSGEERYRWSLPGGHTYPLAVSLNAKGTSRILVSTTVRGFEEPAWLIAEQPQPHFVHVAPPSHDIYTLALHRTHGSLLCCRVQQAEHRLSIVRDDSSSVNIGPTDGSYDIAFGGGAFLEDGSVLVRHQSATVPPDILHIDPSLRGATPLGLSTAPPPSRPFESITCRATDGSPLQAWVARPAPCEGPCPFVIDIHGGPNAVALDAFSPEAQAWLDHGIGYCAVNYRGSISFGQAHQNAIRGQPGTCEVEDCVALRAELIRRKWAQPDAIVLSGWSWGGFVTLLAMGKVPDLWAVGIAALPVADWLQQYQNEPAYLQAYDRELFGGSPEQVPDRYTDASPLSYIDRLRSPVLLIAGEQDSRCPVVQMHEYVEQARERGKDVSLHLLSTGHTGAFANADTGIQAFDAVLAFLRLKNFPLGHAV